MEEETSEGTRCVRIARIKKVFSDKDVTMIENLALDIHHLSEKAIYLFKMSILENFCSTDDFTHKWATNFAKTIDLSKENFAYYFSVVNTSDAKKQGRPPKVETQKKLDKINCIFQRHNVLGEPLRKANISFALAYEAEKWSTVYHTNVFMHFDKYVKHCCQVLADKHIVFENPALQDKSKWEWTTEQRKQAQTLRNLWVKNLLYTTDEDKTKRNLSVVPPLLLTMVPEGFYDPQKRLYNAKSKPALFFVYMIYMNRWLEDNKQALYNPFPLRTTFIPCHFTLDTQVLVDNFSVENKEEFEKLKLIFWDKLQKLAPGVQFQEKALTCKSKLLDSPSKYLTGNLPDNITGLWKTAIWQTLTKIPMDLMTVKHGKETMKFNNMVYTNGYKVCLHYCSDAHYGTNSYTKGKKKDGKKKKVDSSVTLLGTEDKVNLLEDNLVYVDPGKNNLVTIGTGYRSGKVLQYTAKQRRFETGQLQASYCTKSKLHWYHKNNGINLREIQSTLGIAKSCYLDVFTEYVSKRNASRKVLTNFYQQHFFRRVQMRALIKSRSSMDKLASTIKKTFETDGKQVTMAYGDWSASGLRNQAPTQSIGLRRYLAKHFRMIIIDEHKTSQRCPLNSSHQVCNPSGCLSKKSKRGYQRKENHGVLRCQNENCKSITWDRDILSTVNMRIKMRYEWRKNSIHPWFSRANTEENVDRYSEGTTPQIHE